MDRGRLLRCTFCSRLQNELEKLIAGPAVHICNDCVSLAHQAIESQVPTSNNWTQLADVMEDPHSKCNFCGKPTPQVNHMIVGPALPGVIKSANSETPYIRICNECLDLCDDILSEHSAPSRS